MGYADPTFGVCDGETPYVAIPKPFDMATYGVAPSHRPKVGSIQPLGSPLFRSTDGQIAMDSIQGLYEKKKLFERQKK